MNAPLTAILGATPSASPQQVEIWNKRVGEIFKSWHRDPSEAFPLWFLIAAGVVAALIVAAVLLRKWYKKSNLDSPAVRLFHHIAGEVGIALHDQWLLVRIARQQALASPLTLLLSGLTLRHHADLFVEELPKRKRPSVTTRIESIRRQMFGDPGEPPVLDIPTLSRQPTPLVDAPPDESQS